MLFVHGESYSWGAGNLYDGRVLASYGHVLVVTVNYRLGVLGFLNTNTAPHQHPQMANYGLMDQIAALKWVQQNIGHFGGDPAPASSDLGGGAFQLAAGPVHWCDLFLIVSFRAASWQPSSAMSGGIAPAPTAACF